MYRSRECGCQWEGLFRVGYLEEVKQGAVWDNPTKAERYLALVDVERRGAAAGEEAGVGSGLCHCGERGGGCSPWDSRLGPVQGHPGEQFPPQLEKLFSELSTHCPSWKKSPRGLRLPPKLSSFEVVRQIQVCDWSL